METGGSGEKEQTLMVNKAVGRRKKSKANKEH